MGKRKEVKAVPWGSLPSPVPAVCIQDTGNPQESPDNAITLGTLQTLLLWGKMTLLGGVIFVHSLSVTNRRVTERIPSAKLKLLNSLWPLDRHLPFLAQNNLLIDGKYITL